MSPTMNRLAYGRMPRRRLLAIYAVGMLVGCLAAVAALMALGAAPLT
jgi:hypothetical protein